MAKFKFTPKQRKEILFCYAVLLIPVCFHLVFFLYVNIDNIFLSFQQVTSLKGDRDWVQPHIFANYAKVIESFTSEGEGGYVANSIKNSFTMWWTNFIISNPLYLIFSYYVFRKYVGGKAFGILTMVPNIVSGMVFGLCFQKVVELALPELMESFFDLKEFPNLLSKDVEDRDFSLLWGTGIFYMIWLSFGMQVLIYSNAMNAIDDEIFESARLDGVNDRQEFFSIVLPIIWPTVSTFLVTGVASMFTVSGPWLVFFQWGAPPEVWGFSYWMNLKIKTEMDSPIDYPVVAAAGYMVSIASLPLVFFTRWVTNKVDKND